MFSAYMVKLKVKGFYSLSWFHLRGLYRTAIKDNLKMDCKIHLGCKWKPNKPMKCLVCLWEPNSTAPHEMTVSYLLAAGYSELFDPKPPLVSLNPNHFTLRLYFYVICAPLGPLGFDINLALRDFNFNFLTVITK